MRLLPSIACMVRSERGFLLGAPAALAIALAACDGAHGAEDGAVADAGADAGASTAPQIPWLDVGIPPIAMAPCPAGWREVHDGDLTTCDPHPESGPLACEEGEVHFPGEPGCQPIGDPCPSGDYAATLPTDGPIVYVRAGAAGGGDGSLATPYATLGEVRWLSLAPGTTVALAKGTYEGTLPLRADVRVVGACVAETIVTGTTLPAAAVVTVTQGGPPPRVRNVAFVDAPQFGVALTDGRSLVLDGVLFERTSGVGIIVVGEGCVVQATRTVVRETEPDATGPGQGLSLQGGARFEASQLVVEGSRGVGLHALDPGTTVVLEDAVVRDTEAISDVEHTARGLGVENGARLEATRLVVARNRGIGVHVVGGGSEAALSDVVVSDTDTLAIEDAFGRGIEVADGARLDAARMLCEGNRDVGLLAHDRATVTLADAVVRDTRPHATTGDGGRGLSVELGARLDAARLVVARNRDFGVFVASTDTSVVLTDAAVMDTRSRESDLAFGDAVGVSRGARLTADRLVVDGARELGVMALADATVELRDVLVSNVLASECDCPERVFGYAIAAIAGALRVSRFVDRGAATCGLFVAPIDGLPTPPALDAESGVVEGASIGACVQVDGYDLMRLTRNVVYRDNEVNLDSTMLPVPTLDGVGGGGP